MNRKIVSLTTAVILTVASAVPVFAAGSPTTAAVVTTPVSVPAGVVAEKGLTPEEQALVATTVEEAAALATGVVAEQSNGTAVAAAVAQPGLIALAKADILKNASVQRSLNRAGLAGIIVNAGTLARTDGKSARTTIKLSAPGLVPGEKVAVLYYIPGDPTPHVVNASWKNGKIQVTLPLPCVYSIVK